MAKTECILKEYRKDKCGACTQLCPHRIATEGLDGKGGRLESARVPAQYRGITLANSPAKSAKMTTGTGEAELYSVLERYVKTFSSGEAKSLYLWSESPGTGKTTTAVAILTEWLAIDYLKALKDGNQPRTDGAFFLDINEMQTDYNLATMTDDEAALKRIGNTIARAQSAPFAVIDDIGVRSATEAFRAYVHAVINGRVSAGLPTVYTSNLPIEDMAQVFDARLYDRIREQCAPIHFAGESKRGMR